MYLADTQYFAGQHVLKANAAIIALLRDRGVLLHHEEYHALLSALLAAQDADNIPRHATMVRGHATDTDCWKMRWRAVEGVQWLPEWGRARIDGMLANRPDWCISRQRTWGVPIALFVAQENEESYTRALRS